MQTIDLEDFKKIDFRVGTVLRVEVFEKARKPAYQVWVDLGPVLGIKKSSAQLTLHYQPEDLVGKQVLCVAPAHDDQLSAHVERAPLDDSQILTDSARLQADAAAILAQQPRAAEQQAEHEGQGGDGLDGGEKVHGWTAS